MQSGRTFSIFCSGCVEPYRVPHTGVPKRPKPAGGRRGGASAAERPDAARELAAATATACGRVEELDIEAVGSDKTTGRTRRGKASGAAVGVRDGTRRLGGGLPAVQELARRTEAGAALEVAALLSGIRAG